MSKRLFAKYAGSDDEWHYCGGPNVGKALSGLSNVIRNSVELLFDDALDEEFFLELEVRDMTDAEVGQLD